MTHLETLTKSIASLNYKQTIEYLKDDENFLNGIEISDCHVNLYLIYAGDSIIYLFYWHEHLLYVSDSYKPGFGKEWDSLYSVITALCFVLTKRHPINLHLFNKNIKFQKIFLDLDHTVLIEYCNDILMQDFSSEYYQKAIDYFKPLLIIDTENE